MMLTIVLTVLEVKGAQDHSNVSIVSMFVYKWLSLIWIY